MQIQRTNNQQNFGTTVVTKVHSPKMMEILVDLDKYLAHHNEPECRCIKFAQDEVLFADGGDVMVIQEMRHPEKEISDLSDAYKAADDTHEAEIDGDNLEELLQKVPMLQKFERVKKFLVRLFHQKN